MKDKPLSNIRVLDMTQFLSGPFCTLTLADLGAEIIKIERPTGDPTRTDIPTRDGTSAMYISCNRSKKSVVLNLKDAAQKKLFLQLLEKCDIVVENFKPGTMDRLGVGYKTLKRIKPDLIYLAISGYGQTGPYKSRGALDIAIQAMSGFMSITGEKGGRPTKSGASLADIMAGVYGVVGVLSALIWREKTGEGQYIDISMLDTMAASVMQNSIARYCLSGVVPHPQGNRHPASAPFQEFATRNGSIVVCCPTNAQFKSLMEGLGRMDIYEDPMFHDTEPRYANKDALSDLLSPIIAAWSTEEMASMMEERGLSFGEINTVDAVVQNVQLRERGMVIQVTDAHAGEFTTIGFPIKMDCAPTQAHYHAPMLGEDTADVLQRLLGLSAQDLRRIYPDCPKS